MRIYNRYRILKTIQRETPVFRAELSKRTGLNKATVSAIITERLSMGLIEETEMGESSGGRKPVMICPVYSNGYAVGIDIDIESVAFCVTDLAGEPVCLRSMAMQGTEFALNFERICAFLEDLLRKLPQVRYGVTGIGVSVRGLVDLESVVRLTYVLNWSDVDLRSHLEERFHVPVFLDIDGNFSALAEFERYPQCRDLAVLTIGDVVSSGAVVRGKLLYGHRGYASCVAHHIIQVHGRACGCGQQGCLDAYVSNRAVLGQANEKKPVGSIEEFIALVKAGDSDMAQVLDSFIACLAAGVTNMIYILNSEWIVLNGILLQELPEIVPRVHEQLVLPISKFQRLAVSSLGPQAPLLGACQKVRDRFYRKIAGRD